MELENRPAGPVVRPEGEGRTFRAAGVTIVVKAAASETGGEFTLLEYTAPAGFKGPAPHWHKETDESFCVLEGTVRFTLNEDPVEAQRGAFVLVPRGVLHAFSVPGSQPAKMLVMMNPGGMEGYFEELAALIETEANWPPADMSKVTALAERYDTFAK